LKNRLFGLGISDIMRGDFQFMKEIAGYTHVDAPTRYNRLRQFAADVHQSVFASILHSVIDDEF